MPAGCNHGYDTCAGSFALIDTLALNLFTSPPLSTSTSSHPHHPTPTARMHAQTCSQARPPPRPPVFTTRNLGAPSHPPVFTTRNPALPPLQGGYAIITSHRLLWIDAASAPAPGRSCCLPLSMVAGATKRVQYGLNIMAPKVRLA